MPELVQIVCVDSKGELPCALTPFLPVAEAKAQLSDFQKDGHGARSKSRPMLQFRDHSGAVVELDEKPSEPTEPKKK